MKRKKILIADDDRQVRRSLRKRLSAWGHTVLEASDGLGVISMATSERVDALILDHEMPLGDGIDIAYVIRNESEAPIIFLSGHSPSEFEDPIRELSNIHLLSKPLNVEQLEEMLNDCLVETTRTPICT